MRQQPFKRQSILQRMLLGMRMSRVVGASKLSTKAFVPLVLVSPHCLHCAFHLSIVPGYGPVAFLGLRAEALSDLEVRTAIEQRAQ